MELFGGLKRIPVMDHPGIEPKIVTIRGQRVILDQEIAALYAVKTKALNQQVRRNRDRFPEDFMFRLSKEEALRVRSQIVTASKRNARHQPYAFTEHGVAMLSSVLNGQRAIRVNIEIMRAFVRLRRCLSADPDLSERMRRAELEIKAHGAALGEHAQALREVFADIRKLMEPRRS